MAKKWADYLISGVWFTNSDKSKRVTHVQIHADSDTGLGSGQKKTEAEVIKLLKAGHTIKTVIWNYENGFFNQGADVGYQTVGTDEYLRTHKDGTVTNNLDNMINMGWLI